MIWKLLRRNISVWQIAGYAAATLVGLSIVIVAIQFYRDAAVAVAPEEGGEGLLSSRYVVISKPVSLSSALTGAAPSFSPAEIDEIAAQPWAGSVAPFRAADFSVNAGVEMDGRGMHTALFLESVPDEVLDINPSDWAFDPSHPEVPIIISKDYLSLYNFGFAASGRMPMVSESMLSAIPLDITLSGRGDRLTLPGHIVGYSSRLNTVAVPEAFMDWAHARFGSGSAPAPSRLVVQVADPAEPSVSAFFSDRDYQVAGDDGDIGRAAYFLRLLTSVIVAVGAVITVLALGILVLSLFLLVQKNRRAIAGLFLLGYSPSEVARCYCRVVLAVNAAVLAVALAVLLLVAPLWRSALVSIGIVPSSLWPAICIGIALMALITLFNICVVSRLVRKVFLLN